MSKRQELLDRAEAVKKTFPKLKGAKLKSAKYAYYNLRYRASKAGNGKAAAPAKKAKRKAVRRRAASQAFNPDQGFLPKFLAQMNMVRIEEMVADRLFREVASQIGLEVASKKIG